MTEQGSSKPVVIGRRSDMLTAQRTRISHALVARMRYCGGAFEKLIAEAWFVADARNRQKLEETFEEEFAKFSIGHKPLPIPE